MSKQIFFIVFDEMLFEKCNIFLLKCFCSMMFNLARNVFLNRIAV